MLMITVAFAAAAAAGNDGSVATPRVSVAGIDSSGRFTIVSADAAYADPIGALMPDTPAANGTLTEALAWERGLPAPRWYRYNEDAPATAEFRAKVLHEGAGE